MELLRLIARLFHNSLPSLTNASILLLVYGFVPSGRVTRSGSILPTAAQGFLAAQGFMAAQGFLAAQGFFAAQGFMAAHGFLAPQGFFAAHGLHGLRFMARGAQGMQGEADNGTGIPITAPNRPEIIVVRSGFLFISIIFLSL